MSAISHFSFTSYFIAKPIDKLLSSDEEKALGWINKHLCSRVIAAALGVFAILDASFHLIVSIGAIPLNILRLRITDGLSLSKHHLLQSIKFVGIAIFSPLEILFPDTLTLPLLKKADDSPFIKNDYSGLNPTRVLKSYHPTSVEELQKILKEAAENNWKISIGGQFHSQGGHQVFPGAVHIDMRGMNQILSIDPQKKTIQVQAGATWEKVQNFIHPHGLAIKSMQSPNIFTIGGSLSANVHGWDHKSGQLIETVNKIRILMADGSIKEASRSKNRELFSLAIGGYGLMGIILDAELDLTTNVHYNKSAVEIAPEDYVNYFEETVEKDRNIGLHFARFSIDPNNFFKKLIAVNYKETTAKPETLKTDNHVERNRFLFHFYRRFSLAKCLRWSLEVLREKRGEKICRNNAMRPEIKFLDYNSSHDTDVLQEYFIPKKYFSSFTKDLAKITSQHPINLLNVTIRFVKGNKSSRLTYAKQDAFAFVLYINHPSARKGVEHMKKWTRIVTDAALKYDGNFYLPYQQYQTGEQLRRGYPEVESFIDRKRHFDPKERFYSSFYQNCCDRLEQLSHENSA